MTNSKQHNISGRLVLVVDDNLRIRAYIRAILQGAGAQVMEAGDGLEALELFQTWRDTIDLVVTDVQMPRMTGTDLALSIRAASPSIPLIFVSGEPAPWDVHDSRGGPFFIGKPFAPEVLLDAAGQFFASLPVAC